MSRGVIRKGACAALCITGLMMGAAVHGRDVREVEGIEFRGLELLSRHEVLAGVPVKSSKKGSVIDLDALKSAIAKNGMIEKGNVGAEGNRIIVTVKERVPAHLFAVRKGNEVVPFETDARFAILSVRAVHLAGRPLVVLGEGDLRGGALSSRVRGLLAELGRLEETDNELFKEIAEIEIKNDNVLEIFLKGRKTRIILPVNGRDFRNLRYMVSLFDGQNYYPGTLRMGNGYGVIE
ncbi:MAG TPA: hypothetical protein PKY31_00900 [Spirochaetota bacterium]|nr:hypothetical protein [Spirochaetota bacterium]